MYFSTVFFDHVDSVRRSLYFNIDLSSVLPSFSTTKTQEPYI